MFSSQRGFTLTELIIVITVVGILATVILVSYGGAREDARDSQRVGDMQMILGAQNLYYSHNDYFYTNSGLGGVPDISGYLTAPSDPWEGVYVWKDNTGCDPNGEYFCAYATLENSDECDYEAYIAVSEKGIEIICEVSQGAGFAGTGCSCW